MIYRSEKGSPLTFLELDGNFKELYELIQVILKKNEEKVAIPEYLKEVKQEGETLFFIGSMGSDLGTAQLPVIAPHPRGVWTKDEYYCTHDWVVFSKKTYACTKAHVAEDFEKQKDNWVVVIE